MFRRINDRAVPFALLGIGALMMGSAAAMAATGNSATSKSDRGERADRMVERFINAVDQDGDGVLTRAEVEAYAAQRAAALDADGDGRITQEEFEAQRTAWREKHSERRAERGGDRPRREISDERREAMAERHAERRQAWLERMGADADGSIAVEDFQNHMVERIMAADTAGDGQVTAEELREHGKAMRHAHRDGKRDRNTAR